MRKIVEFLDNILQNRFIRHLLFWSVIVFGTSYYISLFDKSFTYYFVNNLALLPSQIIAAYLLVYYLVPRFIYEGKYLQFIGLFVFSAVILVIIARILIIYFAEPYLQIEFERETLVEILSDPFYLIQIYLPSVYTNAAILLIIRLIKGRFEDKANAKHQMEVLEREKIAAELNFLKTQIHPHFLFNTLNNLYVLTLRKSDTAPDVVVKLSEMLDYMLYQCDAPKVSIKKEITLIQHYIDLELLRYGERIKLVFNHEVNEDGKEVAPMILLSIVENAFKHGARGNINNPEIKIRLQVDRNQLRYWVFNTKPTLNQTIEKKDRKGIGSINLKRQLELIYPNRYQLNIEDKTNSYLVALNIDL